MNIFGPSSLNSAAGQSLGKVRENAALKPLQITSSTALVVSKVLPMQAGFPHWQCTTLSFHWMGA